MAKLRADGHQVVVVSSGAIAAGLPALGLGGRSRPRDPVTLQAVSAVGQSLLMQVYNDALGAHGLVAGQVLLAPLDFMERRQYLHARGTLLRLLELGVVPVVNENDAIADDEIRFGDNDRLAALVAHLVDADLLVLLTDMPGVLTADPRFDASASLIEEIVEVDHELEAAGRRRRVGPGERRHGHQAGRGQDRRLVGRAHGDRGRRPGRRCSPTRWPASPGSAPWCCPTTATCRPASCGSRSPSGRPARSSSTTAPVRPCCGAARRCWRPASSTSMGEFDADDAVEVAGPDGVGVRQGPRARSTPTGCAAVAGRRRADLPDGTPAWVVHRDDLVVLP